MGYRQTMEDACAIVQHLNIAPLNVQPLSPQSFFGVYDGHGGAQASMYLSQNLHVNVANALLVASSAIREATADDVVHEDIYPELKHSVTSSLDNVVMKCLKDSFLKTDNDFLKKSNSAQHGSTATTALILGNRIYCANVGDSRTLLCR
jgi:serine/threonine protein phosphatase PrpC